MSDHLAQADVTSWPGNILAVGRIRSWRFIVLAAHARKTEIASKDAQQIPRPPFHIGGHVCSHCKSDKAKLSIVLLLL